MLNINLLKFKLGLGHIFKFALKKCLFYHSFCIECTSNLSLPNVYKTVANQANCAEVYFTSLVVWLVYLNLFWFTTMH